MLSNFAALINYTATSAVSFLLSFYLQYVRGFAPRGAGLLLLSQPVVMASFSPLAGRLSDRVEPRIIASAGMAFTALGLLLMTFLDEKTSPGFIIFSLVLLGFGFALFSSPNINAAMSSVEPRFYGVASGTLGTMRLIGQMLSMGVAMLIFAVKAAFAIL
jgi:MFS family permease